VVLLQDMYSPSQLSELCFAVQVSGALPSSCLPAPAGGRAARAARAVGCCNCHGGQLLHFPIVLGIKGGLPACSTTINTSSLLLSGFGHFSSVYFLCGPL
jgi:hypothetical protein